MGVFQKEQTNPPSNDIFEQAGINKHIQDSNLSATQNQRLQYEMENEEKNFAEAQLDCDATLEKVNHRLKQDVYKWDDEKQIMDWIPIDDEKKRVLTNEGVDKFMQIMEGYINKETLLSNFDDKQINRRMLEFCLAVSGIFLMKYEIFFRTPSINECYDILNNRIKEKIEKRKLSCEIMGKLFDEAKEKKRILNEIEGREEYEIQKIRSESRKLNLREFEVMFIQLKALVESTHGRAWKGEERGSLRRHININEVIGNNNQQKMPRKRWGIF